MSSLFRQHLLAAPVVVAVAVVEPARHRLSAVVRPRQLLRRPLSERAFPRMSRGLTLRAQGMPLISVVASAPASALALA